MHPKSPKWCEDIVQRCADIEDWTTNSTLTGYETSSMLRSAVERNFEVIGEVLLRLERTDPATATRITDYRKIIGFRNRLAHGYDDVDNQQVSDIVANFLPVLRADVEAFLTEIES